MTDVNKVLRSGDDPRAVRLDEIVKYKDYLSDVIRKDAADTLRQTAKRFDDYADDLWPLTQGGGVKTDRSLITDRR